MTESDPAEMDRLAERMLRDYDAHTPGTVFAEGFRPTLQQARSLQDAVARLRIARGERVVGYKIGCVCPHNQKTNGLTHPVWGRLWSTEQHPRGTTLCRSDFANVAIEGEFAIILAHDIQPHDVSLEAIVRAVERVVPVIELHNLVFRGGEPRGPELIANNAIHCGVVRGGGDVVPAGPMTTDLSIEFDGRTVEAWTAIRWPDDTLEAVDWLIESLGQSGERLRQGQMILTGALGPPLPVANVDHVLVRSRRFGNVEAWFT